MSIVLHCDIRMALMSLGDRNFLEPLKSSGIMVAYAVHYWSKYQCVLHDYTKNKNLHFVVLSGMIEVFFTLKVPRRTSPHCGAAVQTSKYLASIEASYASWSSLNHFYWWKNIKAVYSVPLPFGKCQVSLRKPDLSSLTSRLLWGFPNEQWVGEGQRRNEMKKFTQLLHSPSRTIFSAVS